MGGSPGWATGGQRRGNTGTIQRARGVVKWKTRRFRGWKGKRASPAARRGGGAGGEARGEAWCVGRRSLPPSPGGLLAGQREGGPRGEGIAVAGVGRHDACPPKEPERRRWSKASGVPHACLPCDLLAALPPPPPSVRRVPPTPKHNVPGRCGRARCSASTRHRRSRPAGRRPSLQKAFCPARASGGRRETVESDGGGPATTVYPVAAGA